MGLLKEQYKNNIMKKKIKFILLKIFKRNSFFIKFLTVVKNSYILFNKIKKISIIHSIIFIPKIISAKFWIEKNIDFISNPIVKKYYNRKYQFDYDDWFSSYIPIWKKILNKIQNINYLEIGSFEGRSTLFIGELKNTKSIMAVDTWKGSDEHGGSKISFTKVFKNFKKNISCIKNIKINYTQDTSDNFFKKNKNKYNLIYIDGLHEYSQVKRDFVNSFNCLDVNGIIICDDFAWFYYENIYKNPMKAILECYDKYKKNLSIEFLDEQIIFKKKTKLFANIVHR